MYSDSETWIGGVFETSASQWGVVWISEDDMILGYRLFDEEDDDPVRAVQQSFDYTTRAPVVGPARVPSHVRVAPGRHAQVLQQALAGRSAVHVRPTPEISAFVGKMLAPLASPARERRSYLRGDLTKPMVSDLMEAAALFHRTAPWSLVSAEENVLGISIPELDVFDLVVTFPGPHAPRKGMLLFPDLDAFADFVGQTDRLDQGQNPEHFAPQMGLLFDPVADISPGIVDEVEQNQWPLADPEIYPDFHVVDSSLSARPPTPREALILSAACRLLSSVSTEDRARVTLAMDASAPAVQLSHTVSALGRTCVVLLDAPHKGR